MEWFYFLFGEGKDLNSLQMIARSIVVFILTLCMIHVAGIRTFGKRSAMDNVILIILGAVMSRAIVGASPFIPVTLASLTLVIIHRIVAGLSVRNRKIGLLVKGKCVCLFKDGQLLTDNMLKAMISKEDMLESVRLTINENSFDNVKEIYLERNGELSIIKK